MCNVSKTQICLVRPVSEAAEMASETNTSQIFLAKPFTLSSAMSSDLCCQNVSSCTADVDNTTFAFSANWSASAFLSEFPWKASVDFWDHFWLTLMFRCKCVEIFTDCLNTPRMGITPGWVVWFKAFIVSSRQLHQQFCLPSTHPDSYANEMTKKIYGT